MKDNDPDVVLTSASKADSLYPPGNTIDIGVIAAGLWRGKWFIFICIIIGGLVGANNLRTFSPKFVALILVEPKGASQVPPSVKAISQAAQYIGINYSSGSRKSNLFNRLMVTIGSVELARRLNDEHDILMKLFSGSWDKARGAWRRPTGRRFEFEQKLYKALHLPTWREPTLNSVAQYLESAIKFKDNKNDTFYRISFAHNDADIAFWVLNTVLFGADKMIRNIDRKELVNNNEYLNKKLSQTAVKEHRNIFISMISQHERQLMLARNDGPYSLKIIRPIHVSEHPTSPNVLKDFMVPLFGWSLAGIGIIMLRAMIKET